MSAPRLYRLEVRARPFSALRGCAQVEPRVGRHLPIPDPAARRAADSMAILADAPVAAAEEIQRRREDLGFSYFVFGAEVSDSLEPVVAELAGT